MAVTFTPNRSGKRTATLMLADASNPKAGAVKLSGIGLQRHKLITPPEVDFGKVQVGTTSTPKIVTVSNPNQEAVNIQSITTSGPFMQTNDCDTSVAAGASCNISVTFTPTSACNLRLQTGVLSIANDAGPRADVSLSGIAVQNAQTAIFVTNPSSNSVTAYPLSGDGNLGPIGTADAGILRAVRVARTLEQDGRDTEGFHASVLSPSPGEAQVLPSL